MILGIDTGLATCGWALFSPEQRRFTGLGVIELPKSSRKVHANVERVQRAAKQANEVRDILDGPAFMAGGELTVVVEQMSFGGGANSIAPIALSWGIVLGLIARQQHSTRLLTIAPQRWQRLVQPAAKRKVNYPKLERAMTGYLDKSSHEAFVALQVLPRSKRNHAIDACALALVGALRPHECEEVRA